jgi:SSS family solute:Na+ symporter
MFFAVTGAIVSGAGAAWIGGLYWKRGGTLAAWVTYIVSAVLAVGGIVLQQVWDFGDGTGLVYWLQAKTDWQWVINNIASASQNAVVSGTKAAVKFPINGQWIHFICVAASIICYVGISLIEHYVLGKPDFNLDKMLHRGEYDTANEHVEKSEVGWLARKFGVTKEFTLGDKIIYGATIAWTFFWFVIFIWFTVQQLLTPWHVSNAQWLGLWHFKIYLTLILGVGCTIWFLIGGIVDVVRLFIALRESKQNDADNGSVVDGGNAGEAKAQ